MENKIKCPKCGSEQISAHKKGFSGGKAVAGAVIACPLGIAAGTLGSNKMKITCLKCGHVFNPGDKRIQPAAKTPITGLIALIGILILILVGIFLLIQVILIFV